MPLALHRLGLQDVDVMKTVRSWEPTWQSAEGLRLTVTLLAV